MSSQTELIIVLPPQQPQESRLCVASSAEFGASACGDRLRSQRLALDFTPREEDLDSQRKCCAFWAMLAERPELMSLIQEPYPCSSAGPRESPSPPPPPRWAPPPRSAVAELGVADRAGWLTRAFASRLPQACAPAEGEYCEEDRRRFPKPPSVRSGRSGSEPASGRPRDRARPLCRQLRNWDLMHPKSMSPPGHPPSLSEADSIHEVQMNTIYPKKGHVVV